MDRSTPPLIHHKAKKTFCVQRTLEHSKNQVKSLFVILESTWKKNEFANKRIELQRERERGEVGLQHNISVTLWVSFLRSFPAVRFRLRLLALLTSFTLRNDSSRCQEKVNKKVNDDYSSLALFKWDPAFTMNGFLYEPHAPSFLFFFRRSFLKCKTPPDDLVRLTPFNPPHLVVP